MTPIVVVRSAKSACHVCAYGPMTLHFPGPYVDIGFSSTACLHCGPAALPVLVLPEYHDRKAS